MKIDKSEIGAVLCGAGLAGWLFYGPCVAFILNGSKVFDAPAIWWRFALAVVAIVIGFYLIVSARAADKKFNSMFNWQMSKQVVIIDKGLK